MANTNEMMTMPAVRRAREFKLYPYRGGAILDLYRANGRAFTGYKPGKMIQTLKNLAEQGVFCAYPSVYNTRLHQALRSLFRDFPYSYACSSEKDAEEVLFRFWRNTDCSPADAARGEEGKLLLWRPGIPISSKADILYVRVPSGGFSSAVFLCSQSPVGEGALLSPVEAGVLTRAVYDWIALEKNGLPPVPVIETDQFDSAGYYYIYKGNDYGAQWKKAFSLGVLLPPNALIPAVLPLSATKGEWNKIGKALM